MSNSVDSDSSLLLRAKSDLDFELPLRPVCPDTYNLHGTYLQKNTELNDLGKLVCLRKSEVSVKRVAVCNVVKKNDGA